MALQKQPECWPQPQTRDSAVLRASTEGGRVSEMRQVGECGEGKHGTSASLF